jgi:hypothetical protein
MMTCCLQPNSCFLTAGSGAMVANVCLLMSEQETCIKHPLINWGPTVPSFYFSIGPAFWEIIKRLGGMPSTLFTLCMFVCEGRSRTSLKMLPSTACTLHQLWSTQNLQHIV